MREAAEEAIVSVLDITAEHWLACGPGPTLQPLRERAPDRPYPVSTAALLDRIPVGDGAAPLTAIGHAGVGVVRAADDDQAEADALNLLCERQLTVGEWLDALPLH